MYRSAATILLLFTITMVAVGCRVEPEAAPAQQQLADADGEHGTTGEHNAPGDPGHAHEHDGPTAKSVSGRISGFDCAVVGELCPTTHRGGDYTSGVYTEDGAFYFVVNIPQSFMTQYFLKHAEVNGRVYPPYDYAIEPEAIRIVEGETTRLVYEAGYFIDETGRRATFHEGRFEDGRWVVGP